MITEKGISPKRTIPFLIIGLLIFLIYVYYFVGITEFLFIIQKVDLVYYGISVAVFFLMMGANVLTWQYFLRPLGVMVPVRKTFLFTWIGLFVDILVPAESIAGDASKVYLMSKEINQNPGKVLASVLSHRVLAMIISLCSLIFSSIMLYAIDYEFPVFVSNLVLLIIFGTSIALLFLFVSVLKKSLTQRFFEVVLRVAAFISRGRLNLGILREKATRALGIFHDSINNLLKNPKHLILPAFFALVSWFLSVFISHLVFVSLGQPVNFWFIMVAYSISVNIQSIPVGIPGEIGLVEIVMSSIYGLFGVNAGIATVATVLIRLITFGLSLIIGFIAIQWIDLKDLAKNLRQDLF